MKKWFFSNKGDISPAMSFDEAKTYLQKNPNVYAWNPSFVQWVPVNCIGDFANILPEIDTSSDIIPEEVVNEFKSKQDKLKKNLAKLTEGFNSATKSLAQFRGRIDTYIKLTTNLSDELKNNIPGMEKQYALLEKKVAQVKDAVQISEKEMQQAITSFSQSASEGEVRMPMAPRTGSPITAPVNTANTSNATPKQVRTNNIKPLFNETNKVAKPTLVKEKYVDELVDEIGDGFVDEISAPAPTAKKVEAKPVEAKKEHETKPDAVKETVAKTPAKEPIQKPIEKSAPQSTEAADKGIKGMFKSVFKTEAEDNVAMPMSERIRLASKG